MNYIVFDLEWNQPSDGKKAEERELLFEVIEIGAVKLDENLKIIGKFTQLVRPKVYKTLNWRIKNLLHITMRELEIQGKPFPEALDRFLKWCGDEEYIFCSWGIQDLTELQRNIRYYNLKPLSTHPIPYYNIQKFFGIYINEPTKSKSLEDAVTMTGVRKGAAFHRAYDDAYYTAKVFNLIPKEIYEGNYTYDLYHLPVSEEDELTSVLEDGRVERISMGFENKNDILQTERLTGFVCGKCGGEAGEVVLDWYSKNSHVFYGIGRCPRGHGYIEGKIRIRKNDLGLHYAEIEMKPTDEAGYLASVDRHDKYQNKEAHIDEDDSEE